METATQPSVPSISGKRCKYREMVDNADAQTAFPAERVSLSSYANFCDTIESLHAVVNVDTVVASVASHTVAPAILHDAAGPRCHDACVQAHVGQTVVRVKAVGHDADRSRVSRRPSCMTLCGGLDPVASACVGSGRGLSGVGPGGGVAAGHSSAFVLIRCAFMVAAL